MPYLKLLNEHIFNIFGETGTSSVTSPPGTSQQCNQPSRDQPSRDQPSTASPPGTSQAQPALQGPASSAASPPGTSQQCSQLSRNQAALPRACPEQPASQGPAAVQPAHQGLPQAPASTLATQGLHHVLHKLVSWFQFDILFNILQE